MSRPDAKKNITTLVKAFASSEALRNNANLVLIMVQRGCDVSMCTPMLFAWLTHVHCCYKCMVMVDHGLYDHGAF